MCLGSQHQSRYQKLLGGVASATLPTETPSSQRKHSKQQTLLYLKLLKPRHGAPAVSSSASRTQTATTSILERLEAVALQIALVR